MAHIDEQHGCAICDPTHCACAVFDRLRNVLPEHRQSEADRAGVNLDGTRKVAKVIPIGKPGYACRSAACTCPAELGRCC